MLNCYDTSKLKEAWTAFTNNQPVKTNAVRQEVMDSWIRSKNYGIDPHQVNRKIEPKEPQIKPGIQKLMVDVAFHFMQNLYSFVKGSGFLVLLADENGVIIKIIGDDDVVLKAQKNMLIMGALRSEQAVGTNAIGTCLFLNKPVQIFAEEHYVYSHKPFTCSAAPIHSPDGSIIGCLNITGPWEKAHSHTLGMVVAAVDAIEKQMGMQKAYDRISNINCQLDATMDAISYGVILIDRDGIITQINNLAKTQLDLKDTVIGNRIDNVLNYDKNSLDIINSQQNFYDKEFVVERKSGNMHFTITATLVKNPAGIQTGTVITLKEFKFVNQLVNKMTGSHAQFTFKSIIGNSRAISETLKLAKAAAGSSSNVLLIGESGTGKELFAQSIHNSSNKSSGPFIAINCGALPRGLIESELFGYEGGAFTGARKEGYPGKFELANGGTLFLDEIGDMPLDVQVSLLRVLQNREIMRIGGKKYKKIDVRIIAATNKNLEECVENNTFRDDLFYRLNVLSIHIPSLRERTTDIRLLADYFLMKYKSSFGKPIKGIADNVYNILSNYDWPGNIRELENVIERAVNICQDEVILPNHLPAKLDNSVTRNTKLNEYTPKNQANQSIRQLEAQAIINAVQANRGNIKKAAEALGIGRRTIYRKFEEYGIDYTAYR